MSDERSKQVSDQASRANYFTDLQTCHCGCCSVSTVSKKSTVVLHPGIVVGKGLRVGCLLALSFASFLIFSNELPTRRAITSIDFCFCHLGWLELLLRSIWSVTLKSVFNYCCWCQPLVLSLLKLNTPNFKQGHKVTLRCCYQQHDITHFRNASQCHAWYNLRANYV